MLPFIHCWTSDDLLGCRVDAAAAAATPCVDTSAAANAAANVDGVGAGVDDDNVTRR